VKAAELVIRILRTISMSVSVDEKQGASVSKFSSAESYDESISDGSRFDWSRHTQLSDICRGESTD
jgi:hypothetical protein